MTLTLHFKVMVSHCKPLSIKYGQLLSHLGLHITDDHVVLLEIFGYNIDDN